MSTYIPGIGPDISAIFNAQSKARANRLTLDQEEQILVRHAKALGLLFIVVDAINESPRRSEITACLVRLASQLGNLRLIVTSTGDPDFDLRSQPLHLLEVEMKPSVVDPDIQLYLHNALDAKAFLSHDLRLDIKTSISREAQGM